MTSVIRVTFLVERENDGGLFASIKEFLSKCVRITWKVFKGEFVNEANMNSIQSETLISRACPADY